MDTPPEPPAFDTTPADGQLADGPLAEQRSIAMAGIAWAVEHRVRNGLVLLVVGAAFGLGQVAGAILLDQYYPVAPPLGLGAAGAGLWLTLVPPPASARQAFRGGDAPSGLAWVLWQVGFGVLLLSGVALGAWISLMLGT